MSHLTPELVERAARDEAVEPTHLGTCAACRDAVAAAKGRQRLLGGLRPYTLSDMAFRRVEAKLNEQLEHGVPAEPFRWRWLLWSAPVAAVVAVLLVVATSPGRPTVESPVVVLPRGPALVVAKAPWQPLTVLLASGDAQQRPGHEAWRPVVAGAVLEQNVAVSGSRVVLGAKGWVFEASGSVALGGPATLALGAGSLRVRSEQAPVVVVAGGLRLSTDQSAFFVSRAASEVVVDVFSGTVEVGDAVERVSVVGPRRLRWVDGHAPTTEALPDRAFDATPPVPTLPAVPFDLSELLAGTTLDIDGQRVGTAPFTLVWSPGRHRVRVTPVGQLPRESFVDLVGGQPNVLHVPSVAPNPGARSPGDDVEVDPAALARVLDDVKRQTPKLRACYEKWLKANPTASGEVALSLQVNAEGHVQHASVHGADISKESAACLVTTARSLVLSPLGSAQELEVPLVLTPGR